MATVYCDVCYLPGSANDDAGYTSGGGWLCYHHRQTAAAARAIWKHLDRIHPFPREIRRNADKYTQQITELLNEHITCPTKKK